VALVDMLVYLLKNRNFGIRRRDMKLTDIFVKRKQGNGKVQKHSDGGGLYLYITPEGKSLGAWGTDF
jgi:hypothetical protein